MSGPSGPRACWGLDSGGLTLRTPVACVAAGPSAGYSPRSCPFPSKGGVPAVMSSPVSTWQVLVTGGLLALSSSSCQAFLLPPSAGRCCALAPPSRVFTSAQRTTAGLVRSKHQAEEDSPAAKNEFFRLTKGLMEFGAYDEVEMVLFEAHDLINRYMMENPERVLLATWDEELVQKKGQDVYQLTTRPVQFVTVSLQPSLDIKVWQEGEHLMIESLAHEMPGIERLLGNTLASTLKIEVKGKLRAVSETKDSRPHVRLVGEVVFFTSGQLPRLLALTPRQILESAAVAVNKKIMSYAKGRFITNLAADFERWAATLPEGDEELVAAAHQLEQQLEEAARARW